MAKGNSNFESLLNYLATCSDAELTHRLTEFEAEWRQQVVRQQGHQAQLMEATMTGGNEGFALLNRAFQLLRLKNEKAARTDWLSLANKAFNVQNFEEALKLYEKAFVTQTPTIEALSFAATCGLRTKKFDQAAKYLNQAMLINEFDVKVLVLSGLVCMEKQKFAEAGQHFRTALQLEPGSDKIKAYLAKADKMVSRKPSQENSKMHAAMNERKSINAAEESLKKRRKWVRKPTQRQMIVNDFECVSPTTYSITSLSAGGAMVAGMVPEEFRFVLNLSDRDQIYGQARKIYSVNSEQCGVLFEGLNPNEQDLINRYVMCS